MKPIVYFKKLRPGAIIPSYQTSGSSGFDLVAAESVKIGPGETQLVPTGLACSLPPGTELQIRARSGLSLQTGYLVKNGIGTVDEDYRGEICVIIHNLDLEWTLNINAHERFAQGVICPVIRCDIQEAQDLDITARGEGGFGSTGAM